MTRFLPSPLAGGGIDPDRARAEARDILGERRFRETRVPRPLEGPLEWLGERLEPVGDLFDDLFSSTTGRIVLVAGLLALIASVAYLVTRRRVASRSAAGDGTGSVGQLDRTLDPRTLERDADAAERAGDLDRALRLRFLAGLLRLDARGAIRLRPWSTSGTVARLLGDRCFDDLAVTFDAVVYGARAASPSDVATAREQWPRVLASAGPS